MLSPVSLFTFSTCLRPDPWLRIIVLISGRLLIAAGLVVVLTLQIEVGIRAIAALTWLLVGGRQLQQTERGFASCRAIRLLPDGQIAILDSNDQWLPGRLQSGSVVLGTLAWLRLKTYSGANHVELLRGNCRQDQQWRRLQVIWRHIGAAA